MKLIKLGYFQIGQKQLLIVEKLVNGIGIERARSSFSKGEYFIIVLVAYIFDDFSKLI